ncbi:response regulator transcription factor [Herbinix luporum]|uniref:response regulator transcription factor n=1 Tax=Herbinix luporum TaxID=1679721 RepID=UPI0023F3D225|nr:response regulator [Herbinix luporum]
MLKLLIAEDEDIIRKGLAFTVDWLSIGYILVGEAANGEEGIEKIKELQPDVVLTDIMMPKIDGLEMIRKAQDYVRFKSVILTSYAEFDYAKKAIELKAYDYLMKPVDVDKLKELMTRLHKEIVAEQEKELIIKQKSQGIDSALFFDHESYSNPYVRKAIEIIKERYVEKLTLESLSEELMVSSSYLSRKIKEETGHTFLDFLNMYRVVQATQLLKEGIYRVYQISDMTGFTDYKHFCTVFKRYTNFSPTEFMKSKE